MICKLIVLVFMSFLLVSNAECGDSLVLGKATPVFSDVIVSYNVTLLANSEASVLLDRKGFTKYTINDIRLIAKKDKIITSLRGNIIIVNFDYMKKNYNLLYISGRRFR